MNNYLITESLPQLILALDNLKYSFPHQNIKDAMDAYRKNSGYYGDKIRSQTLVEFFERNKSDNKKNGNLFYALRQKRILFAGDLEKLEQSDNGADLTFMGEPIFGKSKILIPFIKQRMTENGLSLQGKPSKDQVVFSQTENTDQKSKMQGFAASDFELATVPEITDGELRVTYGTPDLFDHIFRHITVKDDNGFDDKIAGAVGASSCQISFLENTNVTLTFNFSGSGELTNAIGGSTPQKLADVATEIRDELIQNEHNRHRATLKTFGVTS